MKNAYQGGEIRQPHIPTDNDKVAGVLVACLITLPVLAVIVAAIRPFLPTCHI